MMRAILMCFLLLFACCSVAAFTPAKGWNIGRQTSLWTDTAPARSNIMFSLYRRGCSQRREKAFLQFSTTATSSSSSSGPVVVGDDDDESTVSKLTTPSGQTITLIGTAHLSERSNEQVRRIIQEIQPDVVMVELDPTRLHRIGIASLDDIKVGNIKTSQDIEIPSQIFNDGSAADDDADDFWKNPLQIVETVIVEAFTRIARAILTGMYNEMGKAISEDGGTTTGGGEFLAAIRAAEACKNCHTLVLGDRCSLTTIRRAATLAMKGGDPLGVLGRLQQANTEEMQQLERKVRDQLELANNNKNIGSGNDSNGNVVNDAEVQRTMMEALKQDNRFRENLFRRLEQEVPEFTQAFLKERDYIMSESIRRELGDNVQQVVAVVGLAHVHGMEETLKATFKNEDVSSLAKDENAVIER